MDRQSYLKKYINNLNKHKAGVFPCRTLNPAPYSVNESSVCENIQLLEDDVIPEPRKGSSHCIEQSGRGLHGGTALKRSRDGKSYIIGESLGGIYSDELASDDDDADGLAVVNDDGIKLDLTNTQMKKVRALIEEEELGSRKCFRDKGSLASDLLEDVKKMKSDSSSGRQICTFGGLDTQEECLNRYRKALALNSNEKDGSRTELSEKGSEAAKGDLPPTRLPLNGQAHGRDLTEARRQVPAGNGPDPSIDSDFLGVVRASDDRDLSPPRRDAVKKGAWRSNRSVSSEIIGDNQVNDGHSVSLHHTRIKNIDEFGTCSKIDCKDCDLSPPRRPIVTAKRTSEDGPDIKNQSLCLDKTDTCRELPMTSKDLKEVRVSESESHSSRRLEELSCQGQRNNASEGDKSGIVFRDKEGKIISEENWLELEKLEWGGGLIQKDSEEKRKQEEARIAKQPFARQEIDKIYDEELKDVRRWEDPMNYAPVDVNDKVEQAPAVGKTLARPKCPYPAPENRFGVKPGYRWDGKVRGNGYEGKRLKEIVRRRNEELQGYMNNIADI